MLHGLLHNRRPSFGKVSTGLRLAGLVLYPPRCGLCRVSVATEATLCRDCFGSLRFLAGSACACCAHPLPYADAETLCGECLRALPPFAAARAALQYDDASRRLVTRFKYGDQHHLLPLLARWLGQSGEMLLGRAEIVVPVPLHWRRLWRRRFNQAELLARAAAKPHGLPVETAVLLRHRPTRPQVGLSRSARQRNVAGAFRAAHPERIAGKRLLLIDDVMTSGATLAAATRVLLAAGAAQVDVLTLARRVLVEGEA